MTKVVRIDLRRAIRLGRTTVQQPLRPNILEIDLDAAAANVRERSVDFLVLTARSLPCRPTVTGRVQFEMADIF